MPHAGSGTPKGYWWECTADPTHVVRGFASVAKVPLVKFFFDLAESGWNQDLLHPLSTLCQSGLMCITYDFPRTSNPVRLGVSHIVGLTDYLPGYLPMLWEGQPHQGTESWIDFKYVGRSDRGYQSYGLARPAVFTKSKFRELFETYRRVVGHELLAEGHV
jgi:hypothetical protein